MVALGRRIYGAGCDPGESFAREVMQRAAQQDGCVREAMQAAMAEGVSRSRGNCAKCGGQADEGRVLLCAGCRSVSYCDKECQQSD